MRLYMKQKVMTIVDKFTIKDEAGNDVYFVEGEFLSLVKKLHVRDQGGNEVAYLQGRVSFFPRYDVYLGGEFACSVQKKFTFLLPRYEIEGLGWEVRGELFAHEYEVFSGDHTIMAIHKRWVSWGDAYEIDIAESENHVLALCVVLGIDAALNREQKRR